MVNFWPQVNTYLKLKRTIEMCEHISLLQLNFPKIGCGDGAIRVFTAQDGKLSYNLQGGSNVALPTTAIRFRPVTATSRTKNVLLAANAAGAVEHWHMTSGKCLHSLEDEENQVYALDYNDEGTKFTTAGKDKAVRVYDEVLTYPNPNSIII